jgi:predicted ATPase
MRVLTAIKIEGFKAISRATLELDAFTLLIGRNASGKSSAVEALQWLRDATFLGLEAATPANADFHELVNRRSDSILLDLRFHHGSDGPPVHYGLRVMSSAKLPTRPIVAYERCVVGRTKGARAVIHSRKGRRGPAWRWVSGRGGAVSVSDGNELALKLGRTRGTAGPRQFVEFLSRMVFLRLAPTAIAAPSRPEGKTWQPLLSEDGRDLATLLLHLSPSALDRVVAHLKKVFPGVSRVDARSLGREHRFAIRERMTARGGSNVFSIPAPLLSEGMRRLIAIFALLEADVRPSLLVIEEIENGLDPWTLEYVLDTLRTASSDIQIVLTTHSPFFLDHVNPHEIVHVRREQGHSEYRRVSDIKDVARYDQVLAPGAMYLSRIYDEEAK